MPYAKALLYFFFVTKLIPLLVVFGVGFPLQSLLPRTSLIESILHNLTEVLGIVLSWVFVARFAARDRLNPKLLAKESTADLVSAWQSLAAKKARPLLAAAPFLISSLVILNFYTLGFLANPTPAPPGDWFLFSSIVVAPVLESLIFLKAFDDFARRVKLKAPALLGSFLFLANHTFALDGASVVSAIYIFCLSYCVFWPLYLKTRSIIVVCLSHFLANVLVLTFKLAGIASIPHSLVISVGVPALLVISATFYIGLSRVSIKRHF